MFIKTKSGFYNVYFIFMNECFSGFTFLLHLQGLVWKYSGGKLFAIIPQGGEKV